MLDETVVNILRMRNMSDTRKLHVRQMAAHALDHRLAAAQLPLEVGKFQLYAFNTKTWAPLLKGSDGKWLEGNDPNALTMARCTRCTRPVPKDGTSLENAFDRDQRAQPAPGQRDSHHRRPADAGRERRR